MRRTKALVKVAAALLARPDEQHWGFDLTQRAKVRSGTLYPILFRMGNEGWLTDGWQDPAEMAEGQRLPRRYYRVTEQGRKALTDLLDEARTDPEFSALLQTEEEA